jgi:serine/threonine protein phosphatase PrpC
MLAVDMVARSDRGRVRAGNEDCAAVYPEIALAVLADGMGGHNAGEVASGMAVSLIGEGMLLDIDPSSPLTPERARDLIATQIAHANAQILAAGAARRERSGMGTTVVVSLWHEGAVSVGHVGDSRMYRRRGDDLTQLTRDHTFVQGRVDRGELLPADARRAAGRNILTRALGTEPHVDIDLATFDTAPDDVYLLCSDGLTEMLEDGEIDAVLAAFRGQLDAAADELVRRSNEAGGVDNVSVIVVRVGAAGDTPRRPRIGAANESPGG